MYRNEILNICCENHLSVDEIFDKLKKIYPQIWRSTIYRNVEELVSSGELKKIDWNGSKSLYEMKKKPHVHVICKKTWQIMDIDMDCVKINLPENFEVEDVDIKIYWNYK